MANPNWTPRPPRESKSKPRFIRRRSARMAKLTTHYNAEVAAWLPGRRCAVFPAKAATQNHHKRGRLGTLLLDKRFWIAVSQEGHDFIHNNVSKAMKLGLLAAKGYWHVWPDDEETRRLKNVILELTT
jgi:hypothetical protein